MNLQEREEQEKTKAQGRTNSFPNKVANQADRLSSLPFPFSPPLLYFLLSFS